MINIGAWYGKNGESTFTIWAPFAASVKLHILRPAGAQFDMKPDGYGYWHLTVDNLTPGTLYKYSVDVGQQYPDPVSFYQPEGVHGPSMLLDHQAYRWRDKSWKGHDLQDMVFYELHIGTFSPEGTFDGAIAKLEHLVELGVNAVELMPVAQFPGDRNWGYDGANLFAVQNSYGGPDGMKRFVDACHQKGIAVILDVVYNHFGPEGSYASKFGPYYTGKYKTPWGDSLNYDDAYSDGLRHFLVRNALYWLTQFHIDGLRLDAVHAIVDMSCVHILEQIAAAVHVQGIKDKRKYHVIAESDLNNVRLIEPTEKGGFGIDAQWSDDFHHSVHALFTDERTGYYEDFGEFRQIVKVLREGYVYTGQYSKYRKRLYGSSPAGRPASQFIVCLQNHDQVGNRMLGERLSSLISFEALKLTVSLLFFSPFIPLLFMGEEYGETAPFQYFTSHGDSDLIRSVREGRAKEFTAFKWQGEIPDPQSEETFQRSKLKWDMDINRHSKDLYLFYQELINLRKSIPALKYADKENIRVIEYDDEQVLTMRRVHNDSAVLYIANFSDKGQKIDIDYPDGRWLRIVDTYDEMWGGEGASQAEIIEGCHRLFLNPYQAVLYKLKER